jgi:hypothetical protein
MYVEAFIGGIAFTLFCAAIGSIFRYSGNGKYCPECGRILLVYERKNKVRNDRHKEDSRLNQK